ncbi:unnamed protein product [Durusdinium trenchii]|uniref:Uncharacterized protein n=1 Tax=Durusdinium trenchii TaxID=1381693 RepID=A0ABP0NRY2_9DINO
MPPPRRHFRRPSAPKPPPDEFCPQVPLPWKRELRKVQGRLPRLNKMRITLADERWSSPNRQWLTKKGRRRLEPIVSDDTGLGEAQEILAKDLMRELMAPRSVGRLAGADLSRHTR